jgi:hypothetical protein
MRSLTLTLLLQNSNVQATFATRKNRFGLKEQPEQCPKTSFQPKKPLEAPEQKSVFIVEQRQKPLCEQNYNLESHTQELLNASPDHSIVTTLLRLTLSILQALSVRSALNCLDKRMRSRGGAQ